MVDVVPNHMAVPTPASLNAALWSVLRDGPDSPYARWFDVDWAAPERALLLPVLGGASARCWPPASSTLDRDGDGEPVLRYYDHVFPVAARHRATCRCPSCSTASTTGWRTGGSATRSSTTGGSSTSTPWSASGSRTRQVFAATHAVLLELVAEGVVDGLRIDHPDGLADPRGYLRRLRGATGGAWVVVEKILEGDEALPADWPCAGTTGYDALLRVDGAVRRPGRRSAARPSSTPS